MDDKLDQELPAPERLCLENRLLGNNTASYLPQTHKTGLANLPTELLLQIFDSLVQEIDIHHLTQVFAILSRSSKHLHLIATAYLYREVALKGHKQITIFTRCVNQYRTLMPFIESICVAVADPPSYHRLIGASLPPSPSPILPLLTNLKTLHVNGSEDYMHLLPADPGLFPYLESCHLSFNDVKSHLTILEWEHVDICALVAVWAAPRLKMFVLANARLEPNWRAYLPQVPPLPDLEQIHFHNCYAVKPTTAYLGGRRKCLAIEVTFTATQNPSKFSNPYQLLAGFQDHLHVLRYAVQPPAGTAKIFPNLRKYENLTELHIDVENMAHIAPKYHDTPREFVQLQAVLSTNIRRLTINVNSFSTSRLKFHHFVFQMMSDTAVILPNLQELKIEFRQFHCPADLCCECFKCEHYWSNYWVSIKEMWSLGWRDGIKILAPGEETREFVRLRSLCRQIRVSLTVSDDGATRQNNTVLDSILVAEHFKLVAQ